MNGVLVWPWPPLPTPYNRVKWEEGKCFIQIPTAVGHNIHCMMYWFRVGSINWHCGIKEPHKLKFGRLSNAVFVKICVDEISYVSLFNFSSLFKAGECFFLNCFPYAICL